MSKKQPPCTALAPAAREHNNYPPHTPHALPLTAPAAAAEDYNIVRSYSVSLNHSSRFLGMPKGKSWAFYGPQNDTMGLHE